MSEFQYMDEGNSEAQDRLATSFLLAQSSPGLARTGVLSGLTVTQTATASGSVLIAAGAAAVQASVGTGVALLVNDTQATLDVFTTEPMGGLPRNDVVAFDSVTKALIFIKGEPNAAPTDPTVPDTACALYRLRHAASATTIPTAKIDDLRVFTTLAGIPGQLARFKGIAAPGGVTGGVMWPFSTGTFSIVEDNLAGWNAGTSRWVAPTAGTYLITAQIRTSASIPNQYIGIAVNGAYVATSVFFAGAVGGGGQYVGYLRLAAGDGVSIAAALTYTAANGITPGANFLQIVQVGF